MQRVVDKKRLEKQKKEKEKQKNDGMGYVVYSFADVFMLDISLRLFLRWCRSFFYFYIVCSECSILSDKIITREDSKEIAVSISHIKDVGIAHFALL